MKIIVVGLGIVGRSLVEQLSDHGHQVSAIEINPSICKETGDKLDAITLTGSGSDPELLKMAGAADAEIIIAVTPSDEINLLTCHFAGQLGVRKRIARISSRIYARPGPDISLEVLGVTQFVEPEKEVVRSIFQYIELPGVTRTANFQNNTVYLRGYRIAPDMPLAGCALRDIDKIPGYLPMRVVAILRDGHTVLPTGDAILSPGDEMIAVMPSGSWNGFTTLLNLRDKQLRKVVVFGDSLTAGHLVAALSNIVDRVILVDPDERHGRAMAAEYNGIEVLHGDCTDADVLREIHADNVDFFIAAMKDSEDNVMSALMAKAEGAKEVLAMRNDIRHIELFESLGLDHIVSPKTITSEKILEMIHFLPLNRLITLGNTNLRVMQVKAGRKSRIIGKPLRSLQSLFKQAIVVSSVVRAGKFIIPDGNTEIMESDDVLVLCGSDQHDAVRRLFNA